MPAQAFSITWEGGLDEGAACTSWSFVPQHEQTGAHNEQPCGQVGPVAAADSSRTFRTGRTMTLK